MGREKPVADKTENANFILVFSASEESGFTPGKDYYIFTLPCDFYGESRLSIYRDGLVAHYFGVHQTVELETFISSCDLVESELEFDDPDAPLVKDAWMVLRGASAPNAYVGYAPVTNAEYALFKEDFTYEAGKENYPVVNIMIYDTKAYCDWLTARDRKHICHLPSEEVWILGAGHMPKDVVRNSGHVESGLTAVDAYSQTIGACGGIDFWGNCWEWISSMDADGSYIVKGGSWNSKRDDCRSEKSDDVRTGSQGYANVGFRVVRIDASNCR